MRPSVYMWSTSSDFELNTSPHASHSWILLIADSETDVSFSAFGTDSRLTFEGSFMTIDRLTVAVAWLFPVNDLEEGIHERTTIRAVVVVVGVLPDIEREDRM